MTTADRHTDTDPRHEGGAYRASDVDVTAQDDAARYEDVDGTAADGTGREPGGYARRDGDDTTVDGTTSAEHSGTQRLDTQDVDPHHSSDPVSTDATATDEPRTEGGYPHGADSVDSVDSADRSGSDVDGYAAGRHADSGVRTVDVGSNAGTDHTGTADHTATSGTTGGAATTGSAGSDKLERLVPSDRVDHYSTRWDAVKGEFVDEPRQAVAKADQLVGELLDELDQLFRKQRSDLEHGLDADETSTEDLRLALRRYRSFFDRLLQL